MRLRSEGPQFSTKNKTSRSTTMRSQAFKPSQDDQDEKAASQSDQITPPASQLPEALLKQPNTTLILNI